MPVSEVKTVWIAISDKLKQKRVSSPVRGTKSETN